MNQNNLVRINIDSKDIEIALSIKPTCQSPVLNLRSSKMTTILMRYRILKKYHKVKKKELKKKLRYLI